MNGNLRVGEGTVTGPIYTLIPIIVRMLEKKHHIFAVIFLAHYLVYISWPPAVVPLKNSCVCCDCLTLISETWFWVRRYS